MLGLGAQSQREQTRYLPTWNRLVSGGRAGSSATHNSCVVRMGMSAVKIKCNRGQSTCGPGKLFRQRCEDGWIKSNLSSRN